MEIIKSPILSSKQFLVLPSTFNFFNLNFLFGWFKVGIQFDYIFNMDNQLFLCHILNSPLFPYSDMHQVSMFVSSVSRFFIL